MCKKLKYNSETGKYEIFCNICGKVSSIEKWFSGEWKCKHCNFVSDTRAYKTDPGCDPCSR